jgi:hypothetical protein
VEKILLVQSIVMLLVFVNKLFKVDSTPLSVKVS